MEMKTMKNNMEIMNCNPDETEKALISIIMILIGSISRKLTEIAENRVFWDKIENLLDNREKQITVLRR
jgi:hypothetical protein